jgi:hypothetical protein
MTEKGKDKKKTGGRAAKESINVQTGRQKVKEQRN